jgi:hypothetical protein
MDTISNLRRQPSLVSMVVWVLFCFVMWAWALIGPLCFVLGIVQMYLDPRWLDIELGVTPREQQQSLTTLAVTGDVGVAFVALRLRGHIRFGDRD